MKYLLAYRASDPSFPFIHVQLNVGARCNYRCEYCYHNGFQSNEFRTDIDDLKTFLKNLALSAEVTGQKIEVTFIGGEPTLWPYLPEMLEYCNSLGIHCALFTNISFSEEYIEPLLKYIKYMNVSYHASQIKDDSAFLKMAFYLTEKLKHVFINVMLEHGYLDRINRLIGVCECDKLSYVVAPVFSIVPMYDYYYPYTDEEKAIMHKMIYYSPVLGVYEGYAHPVVLDSDTGQLYREPLVYGKIRELGLDMCRGMYCCPSGINLEYSHDSIAHVFRTIQRCPDSYIGLLKDLKDHADVLQTRVPIMCTNDARCQCMCDLFQEKWLPGLDPSKVVDYSVLDDVCEVKKSLE